MVNQIYPPELQLNKAYISDTETPYWIYIYLFLTVLFPPKFIINAMTLILISLIFPFWMATFYSTSSLLWSVYISQLMIFARVCSHVDRNKRLPAKLLKQGYRYHKLGKAFY